MSVLEQGEAYIKKKLNKVERMFASKQEGFSGILGPNAEMEYVNQTDRAKTTASVNQLNSDINAYQSATTALQNRTNLYLKSNTSNGDTKRNYNVFINKSVAVTATSPVSAMAAGAAGASAAGGAGAAGTGPAGASAVEGAQCVSLASLDGFADSITNGFDEAYPNNFTLYDDAKAACQTWAADLGFKFFGVSKQNEQYGCYTANNPPSTPPKNFTTPTPLYTVATKEETNRGGLFSNGQIGVYRSLKAAQWLIQNMNKPVYIKHYNNAKYDSENEPAPLKGAIEGNWWGWSDYDWAPLNTRSAGYTPFGLNKFPNDKYAWWIGCNGDDRTMNYFYYVYDSPSSGKEVGVYLVISNIGKASQSNYAGVLKINGVQMVMTPDPNTGLPGLNVTVKLLKGKNVFEVPRISGIVSSGFVMYVYESVTNEILFRSGSPGWGVIEVKAPNWNIVSNIPQTAQTFVDPYLFTTVNTEPDGFSTCDKLIGGNINIKTINATYGKNCSNSTKRPLNVRIIYFGPNAMSQSIQISQLVVMAFINGVQENVANKGKITSSPSLDNTNPSTPVDGKTDNVLYWSSVSGQGTYWTLDLGVEYPVVSITYYNRAVYNDYADGMRINFQDAKQNTITLRNPVILTGQLVQTFNVSEDDIYLPSPNYTYQPPGYVPPPHTLWYGYYSLESAREVCQAKGQRICRKAELALYDKCAFGWFEEDAGREGGYPMAHGDPFCPGPSCGGCGGMESGKSGFKPWVSYPISVLGGRSGVFCCDKDHVGVYDPAVTGPIPTLGTTLSSWP
jgi:hypothetical protein